MTPVEPSVPVPLMCLFVLRFVFSLLLRPPTDEGGLNVVVTRLTLLCAAAPRPMTLDLQGERCPRVAAGGSAGARRCAPRCPNTALPPDPGTVEHTVRLLIRCRLVCLFKVDSILTVLDTLSVHWECVGWFRLSVLL